MDKYSLYDNKNIERAKVDKEYLGELIVHNEKIIWFSIYKYVGDPNQLAKYNLMEKDDIYQIAVIGFINAVKNFDSSKGTSFTTYAPSIIAGEVKEYLRSKGKLLKLPRSAYDLNKKIKDYTEDLYYDKYIPAEEVAEEINEDVEKVRKVLSVGLTPYLIPFQRKEKYIEDGEESSAAYILQIEDEAVDIEDEVIEKLYLDQLMKAVRNKLSERDRRILDAKLRGETHEEIANRENISKITITRTLNKIRKLIKEFNE